MEIKKLLAAFAIVSVVLISGCKKDDYLAKVGVCPNVVTTIPANSAVGVPLNQAISITFNEKMNPETFTSESFILQGTAVIAGTKAAIVVTGAFTFNDKTVIFTPSSPLAANTTFTGTIKTTVKDLFGSALQVDYVWSFTTGIPPTVTSTDPSNNATSVALNKIITATFSVPMDPLTLSAASVTIKKGTTPVAGTVSYTGTTVSFAPAVPFDANTVYTGTITTVANDGTGIPLASNYVWTFNTGISPTVITTDPANSAIGVSITKIIEADFSVPMNPLTLTASTFTIKQGSTLVAGTVTYTGTTATFKPFSILTPNTVYTGTITTGANNLVGVPLATDFVWTFTTGQSPSVITADPANNATGVATNKTVTALFSVPMDPLTLTGSTFTLNQGGAAVSGVVSYTGTTASFNPIADLLPGTDYTATITTGAKNVAGVPVEANYTWSFTTAVAIPPVVTLTSPVNNSTGVALNKIITANFSIAMDPSTLTATTFTVKRGTATVTGTVSYTGTTASFSPGADLLPGTLYTATITTGAKSAAGVPMTTYQIWTFTTFAGSEPVVNYTDPLDLSTGVEINTVLGANFSQVMDPLTINASSFFVLTAGGVSVSGVISYAGRTATFTPNSNLLAGTTYTAVVTSGAKNTVGTPMSKSYTWSFTTRSTTDAAPLVDLKSVARFGIIAGVGVSNNAGSSEIRYMDVGIYPGVSSSVTGFPPATIVAGAIYAADNLIPAGTPAMLIQAKSDLAAAYQFAEGATMPAPATVAGDQGGKTLKPGIYKSTSTLLIKSGDLTLDGQGDPNATWIFQVASGFTTIGGAGGSVILTGGAQAKNIFWQTGSSAVIGDNTSFYGNILALTSITLNSNATVVGRLLAQNGSVIMTDTNTISKP